MENIGGKEYRQLEFTIDQEDLTVVEDFPRSVMPTGLTYRKWLR